MEITVIDDSDHVGWAASATRTGEVYMSDTSSMVANVLLTLGRSSMDRLNILDHGNSTSFQLGSDWISLSNLASFEPTLARLNGHFSASGFVHMQHCNIGNNIHLLTRLASIWAVPVYAGTGMHNPVYRFNLGDYVRCEPPSGSITLMCSTGVDRP